MRRSKVIFGRPIDSKPSGIGRPAALFLVLALSQVLLSVPIAPGVQASQQVSNNTLVSSVRWAGYVVSSGKSPGPVVTAIYGSWVVQAVAPSTTPGLSSQWIGIGGFFTGDTTLIQVGSESDSYQGKTFYSVWWDASPAAITSIPYSVSPGNKMQASVVCVSSCTGTTQAWKITLSDLTAGWTYVTTQAYASKLKSGEWIDQRPVVCHRLKCSPAPLADFGTAVYGQDYTGVAGTNTATVGGATLPIGSLPNAEISMLQSSGASVIAQPSALSSDGTSFTVQWKGT